jgi:hypothetical protein
LVKLNIEKEDTKPQINHNINANYNMYNEDLLFNNQISNLNLEKRVISKYVEITTKIIYTYEDGSTKETVEKQNHTFNLNES